MDSEPTAGSPPPGDKRYEFFAFISYKHDDMAWARWLQSRLETYRLPSVIRKEAPHLPKAIRPIFRDQTDIAAGPLLEKLRKELEDSRFLIVICSPGAAKSEWVDKEVKNFIHMGRGDRIIPLIVAGTPGAADPSQECFPPALRSGESAMLGVSVQELGKEQAVIKVVAKLLGLKFDRLWDRHRRRQRQQLVVRSVVATMFFLAAAIGGFAYWDYNRTKIAYYADYVERHGIPQGIHELTAAQAQHRRLSWNFASSRRRPDRVCCVNGSGRPANSDDTDRPADRTFQYRDNGALEFTINYMPAGKELWRSVYAPDLSIVEFKGGSKGRLQMQAKFLLADAGGAHAGPGIAECCARKSRPGN